MTANQKKEQIIFINLHQPPYEDENILNKTGWKIEDVKITEVSQEEII